MVFAKCLKGGDGRLDHGDVAGLEDHLEDLEDAWCEEGEVFRRLFDEGSEDLESDLDIPAGLLSVLLDSGRPGETKWCRC